MASKTPWDDDPIDDEAADVGTGTNTDNGGPSGPWDNDPLDSEALLTQDAPNPELDYFFDPSKSALDRVLHAAKTAGSMADNVARLAARGATFGGADALIGKMTGEDELAKTNAAREQLGAGGNIAELGGAVAGSAAMTPARMVASLPGAIATGMGMSGAQTAGTSYFDTGELPSAGEMATSTVLGGIMGAVGNTIGKVFQRPALNPNAEQHIDTLTREGIDVTSGQATRNRNMLHKEAAAGGAQEFQEKQTTDFSRAALRRAGIVSEQGILDPQSLDDGFRAVGGQMDQLAATHHISGTAGAQVFPDLVRDAHDIAQRYTTSVEGGPAAIVGNTVRAIRRAAQRGTLTGDEYQSISSSLEAAARSNPRLATTARELRGSLNAAMERYITATDPASANLWQMANRRYANLLVIENAYNRGGKAGAEGIITPQALANATKQVRGNRLYARGRTDFDDLARAGVAYIQPLPIGTSGSSEEIAKILARKIGRAGAAGAAVHASTGSIPAALAGAVAPEMLGQLGGRMALAPVASLSRTAASTGGAFGTMLGAGAATQNPFERAKQ